MLRDVMAAVKFSLFTILIITFNKSQIKVSKSETQSIKNTHGMRGITVRGFHVKFTVI